MRHRKHGRRFNRTSEHRSAMFSNMASSLIKSELIITTLPKAKDLRPILEKLVTLARKGTLASRRLLISRIRDQEAVSKLIDVIAPRYATHPGGYLSIVKTGFRAGDNAPMAAIRFIKNQEISKTVDA